MANVYYSYPSNRLGILRAILSTEEGRCLLDKHPAQYFGQQFPTTRQDPRPDFAVLRIFEGEESKQCRAGFYLLEEDIMQVEAAVHSCDATQCNPTV
jgi:hypothetical protein